MVCYFVVQYYSFNDLVHVNHFYMDAQKAVKYDQVKPTIFDADKVGKDQSFAMGLFPMYTLTIGLTCDDINVYVRVADKFTMAEDMTLSKKYLTCLA